jgi:hypothetical protein
MPTKHHQVSFEIRKTWKAKTQLELVHSDMCSMKKSLVVGARYVLTFIDDFSRYTWVYLLKNKSCSFEKFKKFRALVEKQCVQTVKFLRPNKRGDYVGDDFERYLPQNGIS